MRLLFILLLGFSIHSCKDCEPESLAAEIIGTWEVDNPVGVVTEDDKVTFNTDGTGDGTTNGSFFASSLSGSTSEFAWNVTSDDLSLEVRYINGVEEVYTRNFLDCDVVQLDFEIAVLSLNR